MNEFSHLAFYLLVVAIPGEPAYNWRVEGGWDSCMVMEEMLRRYVTHPITTQCLSAIEWDKQGRPGLTPSGSAPWVAGKKTVTRPERSLRPCIGQCNP